MVQKLSLKLSFIENINKKEVNIAEILKDLQIKIKGSNFKQI
jgi:hypothetical protein